MSYINIKVKDSTENKDSVKSENNKKQIDFANVILAKLITDKTIERHILRKIYKENNNDK